MSTRAASAGAYTALSGVERAHGIPQRGSGEVTFRHTLASVGYTVRVLFMLLPYVMTFFALLVSGDLTSDWSHILFHPMGQFILVYALGHIVANVCFNFRMGTGLVRSVNALGAVLCVAVSPLWFRLLTSGNLALDALWTLTIVPLEFVACLTFYMHAVRRDG